MASVYDDVAEERRRQDEQWGGPGHDDTHLAGDWARYRAKFEERAIAISRLRHRAPVELNRYMRDTLVKIAALAVAQIESLDREAKG